MTRTPPRLHVIPATACSKALILRRGPTDHLASMLWDRKTNSVEMGQWLVGRIYEHRADLSPDARHMIYFAGTGQRWWTAISRAPWLRAITFYPQDHTWHGGGAFDMEGRVWLNGGAAENDDLSDGLRAADVKAYPHSTDGFHMGDLFAAMMQHRGWTRQQGQRYEMTLHKPLSAGWALELTIALSVPERSMISNCYAMIHAETGRRLDQPDWEWADPFDGAVQFARKGALLEAELGTDGTLTARRVIHDFSEMAFEPIDAPYRGVTQRDTGR